MALVLKDRVKESSNTTGTGTFSLGGAYSGFQSFSVVGNSNTTYYAIVNLSAAEWEVGIGTYTVSGSTLSRDTILESSNSGSAVNFSAGTKDVFCTYPAEKAVTLDDVQTLSNKTIASPSVSGNLTFTGTGNRITGDFNNATIANRVAFQTSTANGNTNITCLPNGTGTVTNIYAFNSSDPANSSYGVLSAASTAVTLSSGKLGTGSYLPMTFYTGGSERMRVDTSGNVGIGTSSPIITNARLSVKASGDYEPSLVIGSNASAANWARLDFKNTNAANSAILYQDASGTFTIRTEGAYPITFNTNGSNERMRIDSSGNVLVTGAGGLGYGTGSGGTANQGISKSTAVTVNKPTGQITMNNAALAANTEVGFQLNNSLIATTDNLIVTIPTSVPNFSSYRVKVYVGSGNASIYLKNESGASLSDAVVLNFAVIKGVTA